MRRSQAPDVKENERLAILAAAFHSSLDGMIAIDEQGIIKVYNPAAERIFGFSAEEAAGRSVNLLMPEPVCERHDLFIKRYLNGGRPRVLGSGREIQGQTRDGRIIPLYLSLTEIWINGRRLFVGMLVDISDLKKVQLELEQAKNASEMMADELKQTLQVSEEMRQAMDDDLRAAAELQTGLLPKHPPRIRSAQFAWEFLPSETLGGDLFNSFFIDDKYLGMYITDVSGHGAPAALVTFSFSQMLTPQAGLVVSSPEQGICWGDSSASPPARVLEELDRHFPVERFDKTFTAIYMILDLVEGRVVYSNAGHPPGIVLRSHGGVEHLTCGGPLIGLGVSSFEQEELILEPGDRVVLLTDGVLEYENDRNEWFGLERLEEILMASAGEPLAMTFGSIIERLEEFGQGMPPKDDVSLFGFEWLGNPSSEDKLSGV